jgi:hypothetical protein
MSRSNRIRIKNPYPFRGVEKDAIGKCLAARYGVLAVEWHTEWYPAQAGDQRQVAVDHIVFAGSSVERRVQVTQALLFLMSVEIMRHHEPTSFRIPMEVPPDHEDTDEPAPTQA